MKEECLCVVGTKGFNWCEAPRTMCLVYNKISINA